MKRRPIGTWIMHATRRDLILPAYAALTTLQYGEDGLPACHTLCALIAWMSKARDSDELAAARSAMDSIYDRSQRTGSYRPTGVELEALRNAVAYADQTLPLLRTHQLTAAMTGVLRVIDGVAA